MTSRHRGRLINTLDTSPEDVRRSARDLAKRGDGTPVAHQEGKLEVAEHVGGQVRVEGDSDDEELLWTEVECLGDSVRSRGGLMRPLHWCPKPPISAVRRQSGRTS